MSGGTAVSEPRPAATVVVLRRQPIGFEVLLVRRNDKVAFMAGAYVFPGGRVDEADRDPLGPARFLTEAARFADLTTTREWPYRAAAVRELREEANVTTTVDALLPIAHWVTPEIENRRYDTRFFVTEMPEGQEARHDDGEVTELAWLTPAAAIERCQRQEIMLPPPTWTTLRRLEAYSALDEALDWAKRTPIVRVVPGFTKEGGTTLLTLPGDPLYPGIDGWEVPQETRFVLREGGGWLPTRP